MRKLIIFSFLAFLSPGGFAQGLAKVETIAGNCMEKSGAADFRVGEKTQAKELKAAFEKAGTEGGKSISAGFATLFSSDMSAVLQVPQMQPDTLTSAAVAAKDASLIRSQALHLRVDELGKLYVNDMETDYALIAEEADALRTAFKGVQIVAFINMEYESLAKEYLELYNTLVNLRDNISYEEYFSPYDELSAKEKTALDKIFLISDKVYFYDRFTVIDDCGCVNK